VAQGYLDPSRPPEDLWKYPGALIPEIMERYGVGIDSVIDFAFPEQSCHNINIETPSNFIPAAGGYLLYPNKPNTNMLQKVYQK
jgi:hypothetical protein